MKLAVIGSRTLTSLHYEQLARELDALAEVQPITLIISGGAAGADTMSERYARERGIPTQIFLPDYKAYGRVAPLKRNELIIQHAEIVFALWDGKSKGTAHSLGLARKRRDLRLIIVVPSL